MCCTQPHLILLIKLGGAQLNPEQGQCNCLLFMLLFSSVNSKNERAQYEAIDILHSELMTLRRRKSTLKIDCEYKCTRSMITLYRCIVYKKKSKIMTINVCIGRSSPKFHGFATDRTEMEVKDGVLAFLAILSFTLCILLGYSVWSNAH